MRLLENQSVRWAFYALVLTMILTGSEANATHLLTAPDVDSVVIIPRVFNDDPDSTFTFMDTYPTLISITDSQLNSGGFANLHIWQFSEDNTNPAVFDNSSVFSFSADLVLTATAGGNGGEAGLRISPWYSQQVDGRFNVRIPDGEIACFGGTLPFYSFTAPPHNLVYVAGTTINLEVIYDAHCNTMQRPATVEYRVRYNSVTYSSGELSFPEGNPSEDPPHGLWGILNDARVGGYVQARIGTVAVPNQVQAQWTNNVYTRSESEECPAATAWGMAGFTVLIGTAGVFIIRGRRFNPVPG